MLTPPPPPPPLMDYNYCSYYRTTVGNEDRLLVDATNIMEVTVTYYNDMNAEDAILAQLLFCLPPLLRHSRVDPVTVRYHGVVTHMICITRTAVTGLGDPVYCGNGRGLPFCYVQESHKVTVDFCQGHRGFFSKQGHTVTAKFWWSQIMTPVTAVSSTLLTAATGVTICDHQNLAGVSTPLWAGYTS